MGQRPATAARIDWDREFAPDIAAGTGHALVGDRARAKRLGVYQRAVAYQRQQRGLAHAKRKRRVPLKVFSLPEREHAILEVFRDIAGEPDNEAALLRLVRSARSALTSRGDARARFDKACKARWLAD